MNNPNQNLINIKDSSLFGKKLLVLAGADVHVKIVKAAKALGVYTIVTDYLPLDLSPAKQVADEYWMYSITDTEAIVKKCIEEKVDGVLAYCIDPAQIPYQKVCEALNLPCYGTHDQFDLLTDKRKFKDFCMAHGVGVIPEYPMEDVIEDRVVYPILVKPTISRGSRGQTVCNGKTEVPPALETARKESKDGGVLIERYMAGMQDMAFAYMVVDGEPYLLKIGDRYLGSPKDNLDRQQMATVLPSCHTSEYIATSDCRVKEMIRQMGIRFGAVFFQGFYESGKEYMYDPGLRFPGSDFDLVLKHVTGFDPMTSFVQFALTGDERCCVGDIHGVYDYDGKGHCLIFSISAREGRITVLDGVEEVARHPFVFSACKRYRVGDYIENKGDVTQRVAEFCAYIPCGESIEAFVDYIYHTVVVLDERGEDMVVSRISIKDSDYVL